MQLSPNVASVHTITLVRAGVNSPEPHSCLLEWLKVSLYLLASFVLAPGTLTWYLFWGPEKSTLILSSVGHGIRLLFSYRRKI